MAEQLTVRRLIEELQKLDPDLLVAGEGCDCWQPSYSVEVFEGTAIVSTTHPKPPLNPRDLPSWLVEVDE